MVDEGTLQFNLLGRYAGFVTWLAAFVVDRAITAALTLLVRSRGRESKE